jgi:hypothetical protein
VQSIQNYHDVNHTSGLSVSIIRVKAEAIFCIGQYDHIHKPTAESGILLSTNRYYQYIQGKGETKFTLPFVIESEI